jgi:hypothetical protein
VARQTDHFRPADLTFWAIFAVAIWGLAIVGGNVSALLPDTALGVLHTSRLDRANVTQLRGEVATLTSDTTRLRQENLVLLQRLLLAEQSDTEASRRLGALEGTMPELLDALAARPAASALDPTTTASTGAAPATSFEVPGGSVSYRTAPIPDEQLLAAVPAMPAPLPPAMPDPSAFGVALGPPIDAPEGDAAWQGFNQRVGPLLLGLAPLLANVEGSSGKHLVAGPINSEAEARQLCGRLTRVGIACSSVRFVGTPLQLTN